jgi:septum formation protein
MLQALSGATHRVYTAIVLLRDGSATKVSVETKVTFRPISAGEIEAYVDSGEPFDKAGAYGIQGGAVAFVTAVAGSYSNVIGLPLEEVAALLCAARHPS